MKKILISVFAFALLFSTEAWAKKTTTTFTADATKLIATAVTGGVYEAEICVYGTWGSGTLTVYISPDSGTTKVAETDPIGNTLAKSANFCATLYLPGNDKTAGTPNLYYATLAGSTSPSLTVKVTDNN